MINQVIHMVLPTDSSGIKIVTLGGWTGKAFIVPRTKLKDLKIRDESKDPAIYFLFGEELNTDKQQLYIGESEIFINRLLDHDIKKDFWNFAIIFTGDLNKAKIKFLEHKSTQEAILVNRYNIVNKTDPTENKLNEFEKIEMLDFFEKLKYVISALKYPVFDKVENSLLNKNNLYYLKINGTDARAQLLSDGSMNVLKNSIARIKETESFWGWSQSARRKFIQEKVLIEKDDSYIFTQDVLFKSPSAAAATIAGRPINGWTAWKDIEDRTMDENLRR